jgi:hypothetical protein
VLKNERLIEEDSYILDSCGDDNDTGESYKGRSICDNSDRGSSLSIEVSRTNMLPFRLFFLLSRWLLTYDIKKRWLKPDLRLDDETISFPQLVS